MRGKFVILFRASIIRHDVHGKGARRSSFVKKREAITSNKRIIRFGLA